jgi:hypothetical protein
MQSHRLCDWDRTDIYEDQGYISRGDDLLTVDYLHMKIKYEEDVNLASELGSNVETSECRGQTAPHHHRYRQLPSQTRIRGAMMRRLDF